MSRRTILFLFLSVYFIQLKGQGAFEFENLELHYLLDSLPRQDTGSLSFTSITKEEFYATRNHPVAFDRQKERAIEILPSGFTLKIAGSSFEFKNDTNNTYSSFYQYIGFVPLVSCHFINHCGEGSCTDYLLENLSQKKYILPCSYDAGIQSFSFSQSGRLLLISTSYDGPDYDAYYEYRSEIYIFRVEENQRLDQIQLVDFSLPTQWSIESIHWLDEGVLGLKVYLNQRPSDLVPTKNTFTYLKAYTSN
jgi:hypothetical protein